MCSDSITSWLNINALMEATRRGVYNYNGVFIRLHFCYSTGNKFKGREIIKYISKNEIEKLLSEGVIKNTKRGYIDKNGNPIGYYRTKGVAKKRYIEDKYVK